MPFASDAALFAAVRERLYTAVVGDVLDRMGCLIHFLPPTIRPLRSDMVVAGPRKDHVDLRIATRAVLERAGVRDEHLDASPPCTRCESERFFSYRRDGKEGGMHMAFIGLR